MNSNSVDEDKIPIAIDKIINLQNIHENRLIDIYKKSNMENSIATG